MRIWKRVAGSSIIAAGVVAFVFMGLTLRVNAQTRVSKNVPLPVYKVDPFWPKPLPHKWILQGIPVMVTDKDDHIWVVSRPRDINPDESGAATTPPRTDCCIAAPAVLEFDTAGNLLKAWGGPDYVPGWPAEGIAKPGAGAEHAIVVDREGNVWLGGNARYDSIQKFTGDGKFLWEFGHRHPKEPAGQNTGPVPQNNQDTDHIVMPVELFDLDEDAHELYLVDQKRVVVYDMDTGVFKRGWGGHGMPLSEISNDPVPPYDWKSGALPADLEEFVPALHCVHIAPDGLVYVCERGSDRIQVFTKKANLCPASSCIAPRLHGEWSAAVPARRWTGCAERHTTSPSRTIPAASTC
ncbi:MAG: hypothetical protein DMG30_01740 [Acidobacteria bacterium]|nr:MAG: hypothetical protein DMG30_01740 [Acidobacteriota bacterium]